MKRKSENLPKKVYELNIQSVGKRDIKQVLKEILLKKAQHIYADKTEEKNI